MRVPTIVTVLTFSELKGALRALLGPKGMTAQEAADLAEYLLGFFGFGSEVVDNALQPDDRDVFYMLEEEGLLGTRQEEVLLAPGKLWRLHYWTLRKDRIAAALEETEEEGEGYEDLYDSVPMEVWVRRAA
jgi:hypothetical protein